MQSNMKQGKCFKCQTTLKIPVSECIVECEECGRINLFLCHVFNKQPNADKTNLICPTCKDSYAVIRCPKCSGYCAIKNFVNGYLYECTCKYKTTFIMCNACKSMLSLPGEKNFTKTRIKCKSCENNFRYRICGTCRTCIYKKGQEQDQIYLCTNAKCPETGSGEQGAFLNPYGNQLEEANKAINYRISQFEQQAKNQSISFKDICKICIDKQAIMINTTCFHLALCQKCAGDIKNQRGGECPICRLKGSYQKVFKP